jgi:hypothetical protein
MPVGKQSGSWASDFTVAFWMKPTSGDLSQFANAFEINDYYGGEFGTQGTAGEKPFIAVYSVNQAGSATSTFADGNAHFFVETVHDSGTRCQLILYVDGAQAYTESGASYCSGGSDIVATTNSGISGRVSNTAGASALAGEIGGFAIFSNALTATQVGDLYTGTVFVPTPTPTPTPVVVPASPVPGSAYDAAVLGLSPYAYYRLDETTGTAANDASGNGRNGTYEGTVGTNYALAQTSIVPGLAYSMESFTANPGAPRVELPSMALGRQSGTWASDFTVAFWMRPASGDLSQYANSFEVNDYYGGEFGTQGTAGEKPFIAVYSVNQAGSATSTFADGNAHFFVETVHNSGASCQLILYVDGAEVFTESGASYCSGGSDIVATTNAGISGRVSNTAGASALAGEIGGFAIFNSALSASQIDMLYGTATPTPSPTPTATPVPTPTPVPGPLTVIINGVNFTATASSPGSFTEDFDDGGVCAPGAECTGPPPTNLGSISAAESNGTFTTSNNCYLPGTANYGYGTGPAYMPIQYELPTLNASVATSEEWDVFGLISNGTGTHTCEFQIFGSGGEVFTVTGYY